MAKTKTSSPSPSRGRAVAQVGGGGRAETFTDDGCFLVGGTSRSSSSSIRDCNNNDNNNMQQDSKSDNGHSFHTTTTPNSSSSSSSSSSSRVLLVPITEPERAAFFSVGNVVNHGSISTCRRPATTTFLNGGGNVVESSVVSSGRGRDSGGLARMKYERFAGRNNSNNGQRSRTHNEDAAVVAPTTTTTTPTPTTARTTDERRRRPSPTTTSIPLARVVERPGTHSLRNVKQQESHRMVWQKSSSSERIGFKNPARSRPCDSKSRAFDYSSSSSHCRPGAVAVTHHHHRHHEDVTATNSSGSTSNSNEYDTDGCSREYLEDQQPVIVIRNDGAESLRSRYHVHEVQHVQPPGVMHAIQKPSHDAEHGVVELVFPDDHPHIQATLVDPDWERERIREEIEQQAPRALVVSDCDDEHNKTRMRGSSWRTLCILAVLLLALSGLAVGIINGLNLIGGGNGREDNDASSVPTNVSHTTTTTTANPNDPTTTAGTSSTTTTDSNVIPAFKDLGDTCKTPEQVTNLPYTYSANTTLVEAQELACPTILTYFYARWFHITPLTMAAVDLSIDTNDSSSAAVAAAASLPFSSSCITATTEGLDGFVVSMNVYQGTCDSLSCILATLAPTSAPDPPTAAPSPVFEEQPDGENVQIHNSSSSTSPWPTPAPVVKPPPPFIVSKKTRSQVSWPHYDANGNYTLLVSWPAATFGSFELNISVRFLLLLPSCARRLFMSCA
jgi:hypothetical protein